MFSVGANISRKIINIKKKEITKEEFVDLIQNNKVSLYRFAKSVLKNDTEVEDAISEAIFKAYKNKDKLRDKESFKYWMMRIVANESYNLIRKNARVELVDNINLLLEK